MGANLMDAFHRILAGQPISPTELRIAGFVMLAWFVMDLIQWVDWLLGKFQ